MNWSNMQVSRKSLLILGVLLAGTSSVSPPAQAVEQPATKAVTTRSEVNQLLADTRRAMAAGKLSEAESLLRQAENSGVRFPVLNFGDSPSKVRRELKKLTGNKLAAKPGTTTPRQQAPTADTRYPNSQQSTSGNITKLPTVSLQEAAPRKTATNSAAQPSVPVANYPNTADRKVTRSTAGQIQLATATENIPTGGRPTELTLPNIPLTGRTSPRIAQTPQPSGRLTQIPTPATQVQAPITSENAFQYLQAGKQALRNGNRKEALQKFRAAYLQKNELDLQSQQQLQDHLQMLSTGAAQATPIINNDSLFNSATSDQKVLARQLQSDISKKKSEAARLRVTNPQGAMKLLRDAEAAVAKSELDPSMKLQFTRSIGLSITETERYIREHGAEIELDQSNQAVLAEIDRDREVKQEVRTRLAKLVDQYNTLRDEHRYAEMEVIAKRAYDMAPEEPTAKLIWANAKFIRRSVLNREIADKSEAGVDSAIRGILDTSADTLVNMDTDYGHGDNWKDLIEGRKTTTEINAINTARELEIKRKLRTPVLPNFEDMPLAEVMQSLSDLADVNIHLDPRGLGQEGVRSDTTVSLNLSQEISLESALSLILEPIHLTFMIKDEVLKVTSKQISDGEIKPHVYYVADLVVPIPNFTPTSNMGLQGLINDAYDALPNVQRSGSGPMAYVPGQANIEGGAANPNVLQQQFGNNGGPGATSSPMGSGPSGQLGGAAQADFDSLIELIVSTVEHDSWMENGTGDGEIQSFPTNLSLVISQTQRVHEKIADLLEQLRRLQDLQVTIEVRFIRLTDSFFERIGIDFDFNIEDGSGDAFAGLNNVGATFEPPQRSGTVGVTGETTGLGDPLPNFSVDLDVPFRNSSFGLTAPQFGGATPVGQFGFAILSDIEAFFLIEASQGDQRANVLQAPKVTLFNGQQAIVVDTAFTPFVVSVIPVVGEFAAAQQPVIVVLSEGTMMTVQAVVSDDRRYVRLTLVPFFSQIGEVNTFTFEGTESTTQRSDTTDTDDDGNNETDDNGTTTVTSGTTVQLPTFEVISVATTVSVPDGGTVLLGGIKRLREGRNEFGVPLLSKLPWVDRLFRNVGIGRETDSLMMMVTPHIIIQEEEEEALGFSTN